MIKGAKNKRERGGKMAYYPARTAGSHPPYHKNSLPPTLPTIKNHPPYHGRNSPNGVKRPPYHPSQLFPSSLGTNIVQNTMIYHLKSILTFFNGAEIVGHYGKWCKMIRSAPQGLVTFSNHPQHSRSVPM